MPSDIDSKAKNGIFIPMADAEKKGPELPDDGTHHSVPKESRAALAQTLSLTTQTTRELLAEVRAMRDEREKQNTPSFGKRSRREFLRLLGYGLIGAGTVALWPLKQPDSFPAPAENTPAKEAAREMYLGNLRTWITDCASRWNNIFTIRNIESDGTVYLSLDEGKRAQNGYNQSLSIQCGPNGKLLSLQEIVYGTTQVSLDIDPLRGDLRRETHFSGQNGGSSVQYEWLTPVDSLIGAQSSDKQFQWFYVRNPLRGDPLHDPESRQPEYELIQPQENPEQLGKKLSTPHRIALFQKLFCTYYGPENLIEFISSEEVGKKFRLSFDELQRAGFKGNCNDFAEMTCEILSRHGYPMHLLTIQPTDPKDRTTRPWHTVAAIPDKNGLTILDQGTLVYVQKPEDFAIAFKAAVPMHFPQNDWAYIPWEKADNTFAKWMQHLGVRFQKEK